jgi:hypothetical protein
VTAHEIRMAAPCSACGAELGRLCRWSGLASKRVHHLRELAALASPAGQAALLGRWRARYCRWGSVPGRHRGRRGA